MVQLRTNRAAFTLIELLVVVIIVSVLAAVGVPMLSANVQRARLSEVEAGLGSIRTGMRSRLAEFGSYAGANGLVPSAANIGIAAGDLNGRFFSDDDYLTITAAATTFCVRATSDGDTTEAPRADQVNGRSRSMNQDGSIFDNAACTPPALN